MKINDINEYYQIGLTWEGEWVKVARDVRTSSILLDDKYEVRLEA